MGLLGENKGVRMTPDVSPPSKSMACITYSDCIAKGHSSIVSPTTEDAYCSVPPGGPSVLGKATCLRQCPPPPNPPNSICVILVAVAIHPPGQAHESASLGASTSEPTVESAHLSDVTPGRGTLRYNPWLMICGSQLELWKMPFVVEEEAVDSKEAVCF